MKRCDGRLLHRATIGATFAGLLTISSLVAPDAGATVTRASTPWNVQTGVAGSFSDLMAAGGSLYATRGVARQLVRIDPTNQTTEAISTRVTTASMAYAGGAIWTTGVPTNDRGAPYELVKFNAKTLRREDAIGLGNEYKPFVFTGPHGGLWSGTGDSQLGACVIRKLSPSGGATLRARRLWTAGVPAGGCSSTSFTPGGGSLFVMTGSGDTNNLVLYKLDTRTLAVVAHRTLPGFAVWASVAASNTRVWLAGGYPGTNGVLIYLDGLNLRILAESPDLATKGSDISADLPEFALWPDLSLADGRIWVTSEGADACFSPSGREVLNLYVDRQHRPIVSSQLTEVGGKLWGLGGDPASSSQDIVRVNPPAACVA